MILLLTSISLSPYASKLPRQTGVLDWLYYLAVENFSKKD